MVITETWFDGLEHSSNIGVNINVDIRNQATVKK